MAKYHKPLIFIPAVIILLAGMTYLLIEHKSNASSHFAEHPATPRYWIMTNQALNQVSANAKARAAISRDIIYSPGYDPSLATPTERGLFIIPTKVYRSEAQLATDITSGKIPTYVKAILYDNEPWSFTPESEQQDPVLYYGRAFALAHQYGYYLIAAPVPNSNVPAVAPYADIVDIQAQYAQQSASIYTRTISMVARKAAQANPHAIILSGLSTNPPAGDPTPQQLDNIYNATYPNLVEGYWLNIPSQGASCPSCNSQQPNIATAFLADTD